MTTENSTPQTPTPQPGPTELLYRRRHWNEPALIRDAREQDAALAALTRQRDELLAAASTIYAVTKNAFSRVTPVACPHGNIPSYPTHALWCDECWEALEAAIALARGEAVRS